MFLFSFKGERDRDCEMASISIVIDATRLIFGRDCRTQFKWNIFLFSFSFLQLPFPFPKRICFNSPIGCLVGRLLKIVTNFRKSISRLLRMNSIKLNNLLTFCPFFGNFSKQFYSFISEFYWLLMEQLF